MDDTPDYEEQKIMNFIITKSTIYTENKNNRTEHIPEEEPEQVHMSTLEYCPTTPMA